jgi:hypothetical protein
MAQSAVSSAAALWNEAVAQLDFNTRTIKLTANAFYALGENCQAYFKQQAR